MEQREGLEDLPILVLKHLFGLLDYASRQKCRQVSSKLKAFADEIGLSVKIDTRKPENASFYQNVNVTEAHVLHMIAVNLGKEEMESWKTAILSGPVDNRSLSNGLQMNCSNLRVLIIRDECLASQDFSGPIQPLPVFNHLTTVQLSLIDINFRKVHNASEQLIDESFSKIDTRIQNNMAYLMQTIRSRVLKVFHASAYLHSCPILQVRWDHKPLFEFLQSHRNTLEEVALKNLFPGEVDHRMHEFPVKLQTLLCFAPHREQLSAYWKALLLAQQTLKQLAMYNESNSPEFFPFIQSVLSNNARTLTTLHLGDGSIRMEQCTLDMKMLMECEFLECLVIETMSKVMILNLNYLPFARLKTLSLLGQKIRFGEDFDGVRMMQDSNLTSLRIQGVSKTGLFQDSKLALKFIKITVRSRTLNAFHFTMRIQVNNRRDWDLNCMRDSGDMKFLDRLTSLERDETGNLICSGCRIWDTHDQAHCNGYSTATFLPSFTYEPRAVDMNYLGILSCIEELGYRNREQPFNIPRNKDSYSILENQETAAYKILPNTESYTSRVDDITRVQATILTSEWISYAALPHQALEDCEVQQPEN